MEHYTKAAEILNITQPCITYTVRVLEEELGVKLFEKDGNRERGVTFRPFCSRVVSVDLIADLKAQKYDVAFCSKIEGEPSVDFVPVLHEELVLITPPGHPLAERTSVTLDETLAYRHITFKSSSGIYRIISDMFMNAVGRMPDSAYELEEDQVIAGFIAHSSLIAVVPNMPILKSLDVKVLPLKDSTYERNFYMATLKNVYQSPALASFIRYVKENVGAYFGR